MTLWVGTYRKKGGAGLYPLEGRDRCWQVGAVEPRIDNASFAVWSKRHRLVYFVDEQEHGRITAWRREGGWQQVGDVASGGQMPCYLALSGDEKWLACANYQDGTVTIMRLENGIPVEITASFRAEGRGPDAKRQDGPHAHCVVFGEEDRVLYHVDLGLDCVFRHRLEQGRILDTGVAFAASPGAGPRHLVLAPDHRALLVCELSAQLLLLRQEGDRFTCIDEVATVPEVTSKDNLGGHLMLDSQGRVLVTNRGHDSLVRFANVADRLKRQGWSFTGGASPRHVLEQSGRFLVAHEEGGGVSSVDLEVEAFEPAALIGGAGFLFDMGDRELAREQSS